MKTEEFFCETAGNSAVRIAGESDAHAVAGLAALMWGSHTVESLETEFAKLLADENARVLLLYVNGAPVGFAQCQLRHDYVEGTATTPVGYLEGIFIKEDSRKKGYAKALLESCENWAKGKGCAEFASDCELDNDISLAFHKAVGFEEANRIICFAKKLN